MVKSARSKAIAKKRKNRSHYLLQKNIEKKKNIGWTMIRTFFYFLILFYKSRNKKLNKDKSCNLIECPIPINHFLYKNGILIKDITDDTTSSSSLDTEILKNRYETVTAIGNTISVRTHNKNIHIIKNVLDDICKKVCRLVSSRQYSTRIYQNCLESRIRKKQQERFSYHNNKTKRIKRLINKSKMYHENKDKRDRKKENQKQIYSTNDILRKKKCSKLKHTYQTNETLRQQKCSYLKEIYKSNDNIRKQKCKELQDRYQSNENIRKQKCKQLQDRYQLNQNIQKQKCKQLQDRYQSNQNIRKQKCKQLQDRYQSNENVRKQKLKQLQDRYQSNEHIRKQKCEQLREKYKTNDNIRKQKQKANHLQYVNLEKRQHKLFCLRQKYRNNLQRLENTAKILLETHNSLNGPINQIHLTNILRQTKINQMKLYATLAKQVREKYLLQANQKKQKLDFYEQEFRNYIEQMPKFVCTVCHRCMFQSDVLLCNREKYKIKFNNDKWYSAIKCFSNTYVDEFAFDPCKRKEWICKSCHSSLWKGNIPERSVLSNNTLSGHLPDEIKVLNDLERHLIALRLPFMKMISLPKGGQKGCKGPVICVPSEVQDTANILPRHPSQSAFIRLKLKRRLNYRGWYKYQMISPDHVRAALRILSKINENYKNIEIDNNDYDYFNWDDHIITDSNHDEFIDLSVKKINTDNENKNEENEIHGDEADDELDPRKKFSIPTDTCLQSNIAEDYVDFENDIISIAPAEKNRPASLLREKGLEAKAFPHLFPDGKNTYDEERENKIKFSTYVNNRLFSADFRYASDPHYIFFLQYLNDIQHASSGISLQLRKSCSKSQFTLENITNRKHLSNMFKKDMIFKHLIKVRGSPQYWSSTLSELFAMIRQLGVPTWFCSFSAADARWIELLHHLADYHNIPRKKKYTWNEKNYLLRTNPVIVARIFDRRFRGFMKNIILSKCAALGEVSDYFYRVEFQKRGSPHIHMIVWIKNAPKYGENSDEEVTAFIDKYSTCKMPNEKKNLYLYEIIKNVQTHSKSHSKSCKRRNKVCRFYFPRPISQRTFIVDKKFEKIHTNHDNNDDGDKEKNELDEMKRKIKEINTYLKAIEDKNITLNWNHFDESLLKVKWNYDKYEQALKTILPADTVVLKRSPEDRWVNNYNEKCIINWNANMDIQYVMNAYACAKYMLSYICKAEKEMSDILKNVHQEAKEKNMSIQEEMKVLSGVYFHHREVCVQEAVYRVCSLKLKQASRKVEFVPTDPDCFRLSKPLSMIKKMVEEGKENNDDLLYSNYMDKYLDRPDDPLFNICLADFVAKFSFINKRLKRSRVETWALKTLNFLVYKRKRDIVIRYPRFDPNDDEERYYLNLMRLFLPIRKESDIKEPYSEFYHNGHIKTTTGEIKSIKKIVLSNRERYESKVSKQLEDAMQDIVDNNIQEDAWGILCAESEIEKEEILDSIKNKYKNLTDLDKDENPDVQFLSQTKKKKNLKEKNTYEIHQTKYDSEKIREMLKKMTDEQLNIFYYVRDWCVRKTVNKDIDSLRLFITGGAGTGKSHLLKCMFYEANKILNKINDNTISEIRTLICAPTNAAALNMNCNTIHSTFKVGMRNFNISENILNTMRSKLDGLVLLFIDEISLIDQSLWRELHTRLAQITHQTGSNMYFGNVSIVAVGDFYQLPPVKGIPLYLSINVIDYWQSLFEYCELTICQRTKEAEYYALANRIRKKSKKEPFSEKDKQLLQRCVDRYNSKMYQEDCLHLFAWNQFVDDHNENMLSLKCKDIVEVPSNKIGNIQKLSNRKIKQKFTKYNNKNLKIALGARVIIEENADRDDGIVKGAFGNIVQIVFNSIKRDFVDHIRIKFDNPDCGRQHQKICQICQKEKTVCINRYNNPRDEDENRRKTEQFPIRLGWASTVHKVQGLTVKGVVIDLKRFNQPGQGYASFTRPPNMDEVFLKQLRDEAFFCDERIEESLNKMRKMSYKYVDIEQRSFFRLGFHNVEGLQPHYDDIKNHHWYTTCNIICINETWLKSRNYESELEGFTLVTQNRSDSYNNPKLYERDRGGVGIFIKHNTAFEIIDLPICNIESLTIKTNVTNKTCFITTVYKPPNMNSTTFITNFKQQILFIDLQNNQHIITGDFNENQNRMNSSMYNFFKMEGYKRLIFENTTIGNTSLDCIFTKNIDAKEKINIIPAYFSYHSALMLDLFEQNSTFEETNIINDNFINNNSNNLSSPSILKSSCVESEISNKINRIKSKKDDVIGLKTPTKKKKTPLNYNKKKEYIKKKNSSIIRNSSDFLKTLHLSKSFNNKSWYDSQDIENLLENVFKIKENYLLSNNRYVHIITPILGTSSVNNIYRKHNELYDQIQAFQHQRLFNPLYATFNELIIPINMKGKHWVLLIIEYLQPNNNNHVFYFDSLANQIPEFMSDILIKSNIIENRNQINSNIKRILQTDERNCGPWIIACATKWLETKRINVDDLLTIDIEQERTVQETYLSNLSHSTTIANQ